MTSITKNFNAKSWITVDPNSDFPIQNIPFGIGQTEPNKPFVSTIIGDQVINVSALNAKGYLKGIDFDANVLDQPFLNDFISLGKSITNPIREAIASVFESSNSSLKDHAEDQQAILTPVDQVQLLLPVKVGDYTDFYSSKQHAYNVGCMFRDPENAIMPNWVHLPVGYHGRASSIIVSGTPIHRPCGQQIPADSTQPVYGPCRLLDFELEMGYIIGKSTQLGDRLSTEEAEDHVFGFTLFNDWSARDIQKWEYVPLGPFLGKSFASTISPWIVTIEALENFRLEGPVQEPEVLPYLQYKGAKRFDVRLEVAIQPDGQDPFNVTRSNYKYMYWNYAQQIAHHTVNGCNINVGDMYASGTISGDTPDSYGSMLELSWKGTKPIHLPDGSERKFIADGDTVILQGFGIHEGVRIGFGEVSNKVLPAK